MTTIESKYPEVKRGFHETWLLLERMNDNAIEYAREGEAKYKGTVERPSKFDEGVYCAYVYWLKDNEMKPGNALEDTWLARGLSEFLTADEVQKVLEIVDGLCRYCFDGDVGDCVCWNDE